MATREHPDVLDPGTFGASLHAFLQASLRLAPLAEPPLARRIREHLGDREPVSLRVLKREHPVRDHPNLQIALDVLAARPEVEMEVVGLDVGEHWAPPSLSSLLGAQRSIGPDRGLEQGPLEYVSVALAGTETVACLINALLLLRREDRPLVVLLTRGEGRMGNATIRLEALAAEPEDGEGLLADLRALMNERNVYRGRVLAFTQTEEGAVRLEIRGLPAVARERIVLPEGVLDRVERHAVGPVRHREKLLAAGRHLKRGMLLHGPPGTGKTLTAMHLVALMPGRTVVILTGESLGLLEAACGLARELEPAAVIVEDVDLVARARVYRGGGGPLLFELLNQMDGLAEDADVLFLLTTNRPDLLEPALAARPGRIDEAVELALPDAAGRRRLLELYAEGLDVRAQRLDALVEGLDGASPAHIRELLRKAALLAAEERPDGDLVVEDRHLEAARGALVILAPRMLHDDEDDDLDMDLLDIDDLE